MKNNYKIVREPGYVKKGTTRYIFGDYRILNNTTSTLHPNRFRTLGQAEEKVRQLNVWNYHNHSANGIKRTAKGNAKYIAKLKEGKK